MISKNFYYISEASEIISHYWDFISEGSETFSHCWDYISEGSEMISHFGEPIFDALELPPDCWDVFSRKVRRKNRHFSGNSPHFFGITKGRFRKFISFSKRATKILGFSVPLRH